jgi:thiol-disulfide isomerase/thioredoxin
LRYRGGVILLAVCLTLTGCSLFGKKSSTPSAQRTSDPPPPQLNPSREPTPASTVSTTSQGGGVVAGQILDYYNHRPSAMFIRVVDLEDIREPRPAPIETQANDQGYFTISGLRPGGQYQLIARGQEGERTLAGTIIAKPPNPRLTIWVSEEATPAVGSPVAQPSTPGRSPDDVKRPAASLEAPIAGPPTARNPAEPRPGESPTASNPNPAPPPPAPTPVTTDPSRTATNDAPVKDGFQRAPAVSIPAAPKPQLPPPPGSSVETAPPTTNSAPRQPAPQPPGPLSRVSEASVPVPSCQLVGRKLVNLALYDVNGEVWEYRKNRNGQGRISRLVLLDFWFSSCGPCRQAMPKLYELQKTYGPFGLDVVGIANESGSIKDQVDRVRGVRGRYNIRYPTLLASGPRCPVLTQFDIQAYPTLILLDENGEIIFRSKDGLSDRDHRELVFEIHRRLISR